MSLITEKTKIAKLLAIMFVAHLGLTACGTETDRAQVTPAPLPADEQPIHPETEYSLLTTNGMVWENQQQETVRLRGINLGNWLSMEMWMFGNDQPIGSGITDQCLFEDKLTERFGADEKELVLDIHRDNWIKSSDWDQIKSTGFNLVRVPFPFDLIEDVNNPKTLRADAWHYLDLAIAEAKAREIYIVLDLHGAAGRQGWEQHTGCADKNELWDNNEYRDRTKWLWGEIASKYKDEATVAGYGLLNEPWGTDAETLKDLVVELYQSVRAVDDKHIVILPAHNSGEISAYGDPVDLGMENVAFESHKYPGIFGWGDIGYDVHREWLTCGEEGDGGLCDLVNKASAVNTAMFIGEMQPWTGLGELGGDITRATFDIYNDHHWAATAWSYKTTSNAGGLGQGPWGLVTNQGDQLLTSANTWACDNWQGTFAEACSTSARSTVPHTEDGLKTMYLVIKTGAFNGTDVTYDEIALVNDSTGENILLNGSFGSNENWTEVGIWGDPRTYDFNYSAGEFAESDTGAALHVTSPAGNQSLIYQAVDIIGGQSYTLSGKFIDNGDTNKDMWSEIYLVPDLPEEGVDVTGRVLPEVNVNDDSLETIKAYFSAFGSMDYVINQAVVDSMTSEIATKMFQNIPGKSPTLYIEPSDTVNAIAWEAASGDISGYHLYRSTSPSSGFEKITSVSGRSYNDTAIEVGITYYYYVTAYNSVDEGYAGPIKASGDTFYPVPGKIEAENYSAAHSDVETETSGDEGGGFNVGHFEIDRWVEYTINVETAGEYTVEFRLASDPGSDGFDIQLNGETLGTVSLAATGGWQEYITVSRTLTLPAGESTFRLNSVGKEWNFNWLNFILN